jgi:hypothetical protein
MRPWTNQREVVEVLEREPQNPLGESAAKNLLANCILIESGLSAFLG